jgi:hypothetical protein
VQNEIVMTLYHFQLIDPAGSRRDMKSLRLIDTRAIWCEIDTLARAAAAKGSQIRVTNEAGGIVILVGVSTALSLHARRAA